VDGRLINELIKILTENIGMKFLTFIKKKANASKSFQSTREKWKEFVFFSLVYLLYAKEE
jgi:hypothetical protein